MGLYPVEVVKGVVNEEVDKQLVDCVRNLEIGHFSDVSLSLALTVRYYYIVSSCYTTYTGKNIDAGLRYSPISMLISWIFNL